MVSLWLDFNTIGNAGAEALAIALGTCQRLEELMLGKDRKR